MSGKLFAALEQEQVLNTNPDTIDAKLAEASTEVSDGVIETGEDVAAIENMVLCLENATEVVDDLETDAGTIEETVEAGDGLDEAGASLATESLSRALRKLGAPANMASVPSLESFGSKQSRVTASKIALEGFVETIKATWKQIIEGLKSLWTKIWEFFAKFFDNTTKVADYAKKLKEKVAGMTGKQKEAQVKGRAHAQAFGAAGVTVAGISTIFGNHSGVTDGFLTTTKALDEISKTVGDAIKSKTSTQDIINGLYAEGLAMGDALVSGSGVTKKDGKTEIDGAKVKTTTIGPFLGGATLVMSFGEIMSVKLEEASKKDASETSPTLSQKDCGIVIDKTIALMTKTEDFKKKKSSIEQASKAMTGAAEAVLNGATKLAALAENDDVRGKLQVLRKAVSSYGSQFARLTTMLPAMNVRLGKAALSYVAASVAAHGKEEAAK